MEYKMQFQPEILNKILQLKNQANIELLQLKAELEEAKARDKLLTDLFTFLSKGWSMHFLNLADSEAERLRKMRQERPGEFDCLEDAYLLAKEDAEKVLKRYPSLLDQACRNNRITLDSNSPHPKYGVKNGFFRIEIIEAKRLAKLSDYEGKLAELAADVDAVAEMIRKEYLRVFNRKFHGPNFLKQLRASYKKIVEKKREQDGTSIPIKEITKLLRKKDKEFRMDEFIADLTNLAERGPVEIDGRIIDLQQTKDISQGILLCGASARGYIGFIIFKEKS